MRTRKLATASALLALGAAVLSGCDAESDAGKPFCTIENPKDTPPQTLSRIRRGQRKAEVDAILGEPDYSPTEGQYYHSTGGDCHIVEVDRQAPCGYVLDYRGKRFDETKGMTDQDVLDSCWWGAIAE